MIFNVLHAAITFINLLPQQNAPVVHKILPTQQYRTNKAHKLNRTGASCSVDEDIVPPSPRKAGSEQRVKAHPPCKSQGLSAKPTPDLVQLLHHHKVLASS
jgi:hypothetical protein